MTDPEKLIERLLAHLPASLKHAAVEPGFHREGNKFQCHGDAKSGKSYFLASQPSPNLAVACGENGIGMYLDKKKGDYVFQCHDGPTLDQAIRFVMAHEGEFASFSWDNCNLGFQMWMEWWKEQKGVEEILGRNWNPVKTSWNQLLSLIMQTSMNCGLGFWPRGAKYITEEAAPGVEGKLKIVEQDVAHTEKGVPFTIDHQFKIDNVKDKLYRPTSIHTITFFGGRIPKGTPPELFHTGKVWKFDSRKPSEKGPWHEIFDPVLDIWRATAKSHLDVETRDPREMEEAITAIHQDVANAEVGRLLALIKGVQTIDGYKQLGKTEEVAVNQLTGTHKELVMAAIKAKKGELGV